MIMNVSEYCDARNHLARELIRVGALLTSDSNHPLIIERIGLNGRECGFKLKLHDKNPNAPLSPFYLNLRTENTGPLTSDIVNLAARCMQYAYFFSNKDRFDAVVGVPRAGNPFARALARLSEVPCLMLDKYEYNGKRAIASLIGNVPPSVKKVLVVDDLITISDSKREAIQVLRDEGMDVTDVLVLVDREQGGDIGLSKLDCELHSVFTITALLDLFFVTCDTDKALRNRIRSYLRTTLA
jgi:uridine monophosphate synthetase